MSAEYNCPPICRDCQRAHRGPCQPDGLRSLALAPCSADFYAEHNMLRREGFITREGNLHCAFKPGTRPLLCRPVTESVGRLLLPNT